MERFPEIVARTLAAGEEAGWQSGESTASGADCLGWTHGSTPTGCKTLNRFLNLSGISFLS